MSEPDIDAPRVLITGASRGLGLEFVRQYAAAGARVYAACRDPERASGLRDVAEAAPGTVAMLPMDVRDAAAIEAAVARVGEDPAARRDIQVNNAGVSPRGETFDNIGADDMLGVLRVNTVAPLIVAQRCRSLLAAATRPRIANVSSSMGSLTEKDYGRHYSYGASKAALNLVTRAAACDLADDGIIVVSLHPGWVRTDLGGPKAELAPQESVAALVEVIDGLAPADSGSFLTWRGDTHPW